MRRDWILTVVLLIAVMMTFALITIGPSDSYLGG